ncbi:MAG: FadR/GntR family transcriptional regulator [Gammaproteobacteria bacterium]
MAKTARPKPGAKRSAAALEAVRALREEIFARKDGDYLGSEDELLARLGISRPTFRQAARLLEHEQLVVIKRGIYGGFYVRQPTARTVAHAASTLLRFEKTTLLDMLKAAVPLYEYSIRLAAQCQDPALIGRMRALMGAMRGDDGASITPERMLRLDREFSELVSAMAGNPPLRLFLAVLYDFGVSETTVRIFHHHPERIDPWRKARLQVAEALLAGNGRLAVRRSRASVRTVSQWALDDIGMKGLRREFSDDEGAPAPAPAPRRTAPPAGSRRA